MEIYQLRAFVTVAKLGNLTRAAEVLHVTQPAVTAQIKALEEELGITVFDRRHGADARWRADAGRCRATAGPGRLTVMQGA